MKCSFYVHFGVYSRQRQGALLFDQNGTLLCTHRRIQIHLSRPDDARTGKLVHAVGSALNVRGPCYRPLQGTKQPLLPLGPASSAFGDTFNVQCYMHAGIVHVQPSFHPIVWLSRRTGSGNSRLSGRVFTNSNVYILASYTALVCLRLRGLAKQPLLDWHPHVHRLHRRRSFPQPAQARPASAGMGVLTL